MVKFSVVCEVVCDLRVLLLYFLLFSCTSACSHTDDHVSYINNITTCNGSDVVISFNITGVANCSKIHGDYYVYIYYHEFPSHITHEKLPDPIFHNETGLCQVFLTLYNVKYEDFIDATLQVRIQTPPLNDPHFNCSNNFSLIFITDPPSPVSTLDSHINCSGVFISWLKPYSSPSCPILYYHLILNNHTDVITPHSFFKYSWSKLSHNTLYTVSIVAVNGAGYSIESNSTEFITALAPEVIMIGYDLVDVVVLVQAKVANTDCPSSHPLNVDYSIKCSGGYTNHYTYNVTVNTTNGSIVQHGKPSLPLGLCNCRAIITWYNRNDNNSQKHFNFNTSPPISVIVNDSVCEVFLIHCSHSLSNSTWLGCAVDIFNSTFRIASNLIPFLDSWNTSLYPGDYNISVVGCYGDDCVRNVTVCQDYKRFINVKKCHISSATMTSTPSMTPTSSSPSTPSSGNGNIIAIVLPVVFGSFIIMITIVVVCILAVYCCGKKTKEGHYKVPKEQLPLPSVPQESAVPSELGKYVISTAPMPSKNMGDSIALQPMGKGPNSDNNKTANDSTTCGTVSETETTVVKTETNKEQKDTEAPIPYDIIAEEQNESTDVEKTTTTGANEGGATKEPIYSDLAPSAGTKSLAKTEGPSVNYADIELVRPKSKVPPVQSYDDVVVSTGGATVIGATGGDPPPIPDKKSKGATTTGQEGTNGGTDATQDSSHANDDYHNTVIDETQARTPSDITMVTGKEDLTLTVKVPVQQTNPSPGSSSKNFLIPRRSSMPEGSFLSTTAIPTDSKPSAKNKDKESEMSNA